MQLFEDLIRFYLLVKRRISANLQARSLDVPLDIHVDMNRDNELVRVSQVADYETQIRIPDRIFMRIHSMAVGYVHRGVPAEDCPYLVDRLCEWLSGSEFQAPENRDRPLLN